MPEPRDKRYKFSDSSRAVLRTLDPRLQKVVSCLLEYIDITLVYGYRGKETQDRLVRENKSQVAWPDSKHNCIPSLAVDLQPYPYPRNEHDLRAALGFIAGLAIRIADQDGVTLRWGGDWNMNGDVVDNGFDDLFHLEIVE